MNRRQNSVSADDWRGVAKKDWDRMKRNLRDNDPEAAGFFLQQALEKYLKAFLLQHGWKLKKIHACHDLLTDAVVHEPSLEVFRNLCERISGYYIADRYPLLLSSGLACKDIEADMPEAERLIKALFPRK